MKNLALTFLLALQVVVAANSLRRMVAGTVRVAEEVELPGVTGSSLVPQFQPAAK